MGKDQDIDNDPQSPPALSYAEMKRQLSALFEALKDKIAGSDNKGDKAMLTTLGNAFDYCIRDIQRSQSTQTLKASEDEAKKDEAERDEAERDEAEKDELIGLMLHIMEFVKKETRRIILGMFPDSATLKTFGKLQIIYGYYIQKLTKYVIPFVQDSKSYMIRIGYWLLIADLNRYLAEYERLYVAGRPKKSDTILVAGYLRKESSVVFPKEIVNLFVDFLHGIYRDRALECYQEGVDLINSKETEKMYLYPVRVKLACSLSVFHGDVLKDKETAISIAEAAMVKTIEDVHRDTFLREPYWWTYGETKAYIRTMVQNIKIWSDGKHSISSPYRVMWESI